MRSYAVAFFALAVAFAANAQNETCDRNHYILDYPVSPFTPWIPTGNLNVVRSGHTATLLPDGKVLVVGGVGTGRTSLSSAEIYDPATGSWSVTGSLTPPLRTHTAILLPKGNVLFVSGDPADGTAELYDPVTDSWSPTGSLNTPRGDFTATLLSTGQVLVAGGYDNSDDTLASAELYDPSTGTWSFTGNLLTGRLLHTATLLQDGKVLVAGGWDSDTDQASLSSVELYDPIVGTWSSAPSLNESRILHTATRLQDGRVLVAGGYQDREVRIPNSHLYGFYRVPTVLDDAEIYDPIAATWTVVSNLAEPRQAHTATLLPGGEVLVVGGPDPVNDANAESYDPAASTWADAGTFGVGRYGHTATRLVDGTVLVAGGWYQPPGTLVDGYVVLDSAELYVGPGTNGCQ
jgi:N-acetylneuraminic acid mutarotase